MRLADLMGINPNGIFTDDVILQGDVIALDGKSGKKLFDTRINKREYIKKYMGAEVTKVWADVQLIRGVGFGDYFRPVMKCYLSHDSWKSN